MVFKLLALAAVASCARAAAAPDLVLGAGTLPFPATRAESLAAAAAASRAGSYAVAFDAAYTATAKSTIAAALAPCGGAVASFLPPNLAFQVVAREEGADASDRACLRAVHAAPGVLAIVPIPPELRMEAALLSSDGANNGELPPLRSVALLLAEHRAGASMHAVPALRRHLASRLAALCAGGTCDVVHVSDYEAHLTAFAAGACENGGPDGAVHHDSPAAMGCVLPVELARAAAAHPEVVYASRVEQVYPANAFGRATSETTDVVSWPGVVQEYGACTGADCDLSGYIPFSSIAPVYGAQLQASVPVAGPAAAAAAVDPVEAAAGFPATRAIARAESRARARAARAAPPPASPPPARRTGVVYAEHPHKILASVPFPPSLGFAAVDEDADQCSAACSGGACDFGFARCAGLVTPITSTGLTGTGQIVHIADTGIDPFLPFFYDPAEGASGPPIVQNLVGPCVAPFNEVNCTQSYPPLTSARKTVGIWAYADGVDNSDGRGHGTHVIGSATGNAAGLGAALDPVDASLLRAFKGSAADARLLVADIGCSTPGGCVAGRTMPIVPPRAGGCGNGGLCIPTNLWNLFGPAYRSGARVSGNSWGGGATSTYTAATSAIDNMIYSFAPDFLLVWAAANSGANGNGFYTISAQSVGKNTLAIGALSDGLYAHLGKTRGVGNSLDAAGNPDPLAPLYGFMEGRACGAIVLNAAAQNASSLFATGGACPVNPSSVQCYLMAVDGQQNVDPPPGGFAAGSQYGGAQQIELPMCCGCSPRQVVDGCLAPGSAPDGVSPACAPGNNVLNLLLQGFVNVYNSRWPAPFSSLGPAGDERIKPDIALPGFEIVSARSSQRILAPMFNYNGTAIPPATQVRNRPYTAWTCPPSAAVPQWIFTPFNVTYTSATFTVPASELIATIAIAALIEPVRLDVISLTITNVAPPPTGCPAIGGCWIEAWTVSTTENGAGQSYPVRQQQLAMGPGPVNVALTIPAGNFPAGFLGPTTGWNMGANWAGSIQIYGTPGMSFTIGQAPVPAATAPCFTTSISNPIPFSLTLARGTGRAYASPNSGTSMAAPIMAGTAVLVGQYYTDGWLGAGAPNASAGFRPSAALVKATLINSATAAVEEANDRLFNLPLRPRWQLDAQAGFGVPSLPRGLSFATLGPLSRAAGQLPTLLVPGLTIPPPVNGVVQRGVEPSIAANGLDQIYCVDTFVNPAAFPPNNNGSGIPLSITLVWTDPPVAPTAAQQLVNNLDLILYPPVGPRATGNSGNSSAPNQLPDTLNNVEKITFAAPVSTLDATGARNFNAYEIVVRATSVPQGPQSYSLVVTGPGLTMTVSVGQRGCPAPASASPSAAPGGGGANAGTGTADGNIPAATFNTTVAALSAAVAVLGAGLGVAYFRGGRGGGGGAPPPQFSSAAGYVHTSNAAGGAPPAIKVADAAAVPAWGEAKGAASPAGAAAGRA